MWEALPEPCSPGCMKRESKRRDAIPIDGNGRGGLFNASGIADNAHFGAMSFQEIDAVNTHFQMPGTINNY